MLQELDAARTHPVTLLSAFAGSGKTTLLSAWATSVSSAAPPAGQDAAEEPVVAWLSLDALDNDLIRLWSLVIAALQTRLPQVGQRAQELLHAPDPPALSTIVSHLLDEIHHAAREIILILDDYHLIADPTSQETMRFVLEHLSANLHLVLSTRTDPPLPLARLRVRGQLVELRDQELRFTQEEAARFLRESMGLPLQAEEVTTLSERTQGWIAGLHLASISLRQQPDLGGWIAHFTGSHRYLVDYVQQEILAQVPQDLRQFLLHTSILPSMTASLCQAVTGVSTLQRSQELLEEVERANLFVVPLDEQRQWYRQHDLFREALLARLQASQPDVLPQLHQRAARWYETAGELREAVAHALAASDYPYAATVIERATPRMWASGEAQMVHTWVLALPDALLREGAPGAGGHLSFAGQPAPERRTAARPSAGADRTGCLESGDRPDPGDPALHRQKTCQQPAQQVGSDQPHPGACPGTGPLAPLRRFLPTRCFPPYLSAPFGRPLTTALLGRYLLCFPRGSPHAKQRRMEMDCRIRVQGHLDPFWQHRFEGLRLEHIEDGTTLLSGSLPDQAALHGVLLQIVRMGLTLRELSTCEAEGS